MKPSDYKNKKPSDISGLGYGHFCLESVLGNVGKSDSILVGSSIFLPGHENNGKAYRVEDQNTLFDYLSKSCISAKEILITKLWRKLTPEEAKAYA
jgi:hypothetical protein